MPCVHLYFPRLTVLIVCTSVPTVSNPLITPCVYIVLSLPQSFVHFPLWSRELVWIILSLNSASASFSGFPSVKSVCLHCLQLGSLTCFSSCLFKPCSRFRKPSDWLTNWKLLRDNTSDSYWIKSSINSTAFHLEGAHEAVLTAC